MADAVVKYAQSVAATTATDTTWVDLASIAAVDFEINKTYLILANQVCTHDNLTNHTRVRLVHGTTPTVFDDASCSWEGQGIAVSTQDHEISYMFFYTQPATAELVKLQISSNTTGSTITNKLSQIIAIKLSDDFTENTHYFKAEDLTNYTITTSPTQKATTGSFTPNGTDRWLYIGNMIEDVVSTADEIGFELYDGASGVLGLCWQEAEDTADQRAHTLFWVGVPDTQTRNLSIRPVEEGGSNIMLAGRTIALNLTTMFAESASTFSATEVDPASSPTYTTVATIAPNPTNTGNWVVIAFATVDSDYGGGFEVESRLQINPGGGGLVDNPAYSSTSPGGDSWDALDENPFNVLNLVSLTSGGARTINYDFRQPDAGTVLRVEDNGLVAFSVAKPAGGGDPAPNVSDAVAVAESHAESVGTSQVNKSDAVAVAETVTPLVTSFINLSDAAAVAEAVTVAVINTVSVSDAVGVAESHGESVGTSQVNTSEAITTAESYTAVVEVLVNKSDAVGVAESQTVAIVTAVNVNDAAGVSESNTALVEVLINNSEAVGVSESNVVTVSGDNTLSVNKSDAVGVAESQVVEIITAVNVSDAVGVAESHAESVGTSQITVSDAVAVSESKTVTIEGDITLSVNNSDSIAVSESHAETVGTSQINISDAVSVNEAVVMQLILFVAITADTSRTRGVKVI